MSDLTRQYLMTKRRAADLEFYKIETAFLLRLLDDYFIRLSAPPYLAKLKRAGKQLYQLETDLQQADRQLSHQLKQLEMILTGSLSEDQTLLYANQSPLERFNNRLAKDYRATKTELFLLIANIKRITTPFTY